MDGRRHREAAQAALELLEVDERGLDRLDREILRAICDKFDGGPVGLSTLAVAVGEEQDTIEDVYEPYLLQQGLIKRTPRGRAATAGRLRAPRAGGARAAAERARRRSAAVLTVDRPAPRRSARLPVVCDAWPIRSSAPTADTAPRELDRNIGFTRQPKGCANCGFAFLFELLDDYYPAPDAAFFVCDGEGRVIGCGKNSFAFTGLEEEEVIGQRVEQVLGLSFANGDDPVATVLEWGVRALEVPVEVSGERDVAASAKADIFPPTTTRRAAARADPGEVAPEAMIHRTSTQSRASKVMTDRRRNGFILLLVAGLFAASVAVIALKPTLLGLELKGGVAARLPGQADGAVEGHPRSDRTLDQHHAQARRPARRLPAGNPALGRKRNHRCAAEVSNAQRAEAEVGKTAQLQFYDWEPNVIGPTGKPAGTGEPRPPAGRTRRSSTSGLPQYQAVLRAAKRPAILRASDTTWKQGCTSAQVKDCIYGSWYLIDTAHEKMLCAGGKSICQPQETEQNLYADGYKPPKGSKPKAVRVNPGTVLVQARPVESAAGKISQQNPNSFYVLNDEPVLNGEDIKNPQQSFDEGAGGTGRRT